ncbi:DNA-methyltransferase [Bacillus atrophaeus]|uniref:DNA-methyltransferase n=1 Tax=Bacillus atrophaeus TaxID=1452 RepID=UPI00227E87D5|nr:site-specific DNA-methyltransferase [Bacillus atrophaeus]MCY8507707.1 site-specific DNA-methyltransferase [Bacillus atrophaeus]MCY8969632.1 site-specific DNA-methyltransferase [Bacillus atrophaeus]
MTPLKLKEDTGLQINTIYLMDCIKGMKLIPSQSIDMILCDLPYGITNCKWDSVIDPVALWSEYERIIKDNGAILLFAQTPFDKVLGSSNLKLLRYEWIWEKTAATGHLNAKKMPMKAHENILVFYKKTPIYNPQKTAGHKPVNSYTKRIDVQNRTDIYSKTSKEISGGGATTRYPRSVLCFPSDKQKERIHPTQKPVALCEYLIKTYTNEGQLVLDNCMGSATTAVAALNTNRNFIGFEIEEEFFLKGKQRIKEEKQKNIQLELLP